MLHYATFAGEKSLTELMELLPNPVPTEGTFNGFQEGFEQELKAAIPKLREAAGECPACMMAALRQKKIPVPMAEDFSFTEMMKEIWADINDSNRIDYAH